MMMTLPELKGHISRARFTAIREARALARATRSRGTFLATATASGDQCAPLPEAEAHEWTGTVREIHEAIAKAPPEMAEVYICGGYDGADSVRDLIDGNYEPEVSHWKVTVWRRQ